MIIQQFAMGKVTIVFSFLVLSSCTEKPAQQKTVSVENDNPAVVQNDSSNTTSAGWADSLIINYINNSDNEIIIAALKDKISFEWMFDRTEDIDSTKYLVYQLGHSFENNYITDSWLYIDSLTGTVYEYDVVNDSLIKQHE